MPMVASLGSVAASHSACSHKLLDPWVGGGVRAFKICSTEGQKYHQNLAPVLVIISGNSPTYSGKILTSTGFLSVPL